jgi:hypothetical protein
MTLARLREKPRRPSGPPLPSPLPPPVAVEAGALPIFLRLSRRQGSSAGYRRRRDAPRWSSRDPRESDPRDENIARATGRECKPMSPGAAEILERTRVASSGPAKDTRRDRHVLRCHVQFLEREKQGSAWIRARRGTLRVVGLREQRKSWLWFN